MTELINLLSIDLAVIPLYILGLVVVAGAILGLLYMFINKKG